MHGKVIVAAVIIKHVQGRLCLIGKQKSPDQSPPP